MATARFRMAANAGMASDTPPGAASSSKARNRASVGGYHPTVVSLIVLVTAEYTAYVFLRHYFRHAHGG
jgi:hypothetical protein